MPKEIFTDELKIMLFQYTHCSLSPEMMTRPLSERNKKFPQLSSINVKAIIYPKLLKLKSTLKQSPVISIFNSKLIKLSDFLI